MKETTIPAADGTASIGICFDVPRQKETIVTGSPENVKRYFTVGVSENIDVHTRKLGTLIDEMNALAQADEDCSIGQVIAAANGLCGVINSGQGNKTAEEFTDILYGLYDNSDNANMLLNYIIFFVLTNFKHIHKALAKQNHILRSEMKKSAEKFAEQYNMCVSDMLLPFRNLPTIPEENVRFWDIDKQINSAQNDLILHVYSSHSSGIWRTGYVADNSFLSILRVYVDVLKQANVVVRNCAICHKLILSDRVSRSEICGSEKCRKEQHRRAINANRQRIKDEGSVQDLYSSFSSNCSNLRRKLGKDTPARIKYDTEFEKVRNQALAMKKGLSEDSPNQDIYAFSEFLRVGEDRLRELADRLIKE